MYYLANCLAVYFCNFFDIYRQVSTVVHGINTSQFIYLFFYICLFILSLFLLTNNATKNALAGTFKSMLTCWAIGCAYIQLQQILSRYFLKWLHHWIVSMFPLPHIFINAWPLICSFLIAISKFQYISFLCCSFRFFSLKLFFMTFVYFSLRILYFFLSLSLPSLLCFFLFSFLFPFLPLFSISPTLLPTPFFFSIVRDLS